MGSLGVSTAAGHPVSRIPSQDDLKSLSAALGRYEVDYIVIGGAAMALAGFPRATKDIDLLLPVDASNNARLLAALRDLPQTAAGLNILKKEWLDQGYSTAVEADILVDLLFVAAGRSIEDYRPYIVVLDYEGIPVSTLDIDGLILSKQTTRETDIPDRSRLMSLKRLLLRQNLQSPDPAKK